MSLNVNKLSNNVITYSTNLIDKRLTDTQSGDWASSLTLMKKLWSPWKMKELLSR